MITRREFYPVEAQQFLYSDKVTQSTERKTLEEPVRQWCAYELIRAYGFGVDQLEFEAPVRVGSKSYRIDILVRVGGIPLIVVESKEPKHKDHKGALAQVISYANAETIKAEFVVYTNGKEWMVRRRSPGNWLILSDLPSHLSSILDVSKGATDPVTTTLRAFHHIGPLLYKLDESIDGEDAGHFLSALQEFFHGSNLLTDPVNDNLRNATDNLLRVVWSVEHHPNYRWGKLVASFKAFEAYWKEIGYDQGIFPLKADLSLQDQLGGLRVLLTLMLDGMGREEGWDLLVLKLNLALASYGSGERNERYSPINARLHQPLRDFLNYSLLHRFNTQLPDPLDGIYMGDMREYCRPAWDALANENKVSFGEFLSGWMTFFRWRLLATAKLCYRR